MSDEPSIEFCTFANKNDNVPRSWNTPWTKLVKALTTHRVRQDKDGPLWSPAVYKNGSARGNEGVEAITAAVGDFDSGLTYEDILPRIARYEHVAHSTHSHAPEHPKFRVVVPFAGAVPAADWPDVKARIDEHVFRFANDPVAKDAARIYYLPSCRPGAEHFARHNPGEILDPYALPPASRPAVATESPTPGEDGSKPKVPLGKTALDFVANGAPIGQQRERALAAARNYLSAGYSEKEAAEAIWRGLQASSQDPDRDPWAKDEAIAIVLDLAGKPAPPLKELPPKPGDVPPQNGREHPSGQPPAVRRPVVVRLDSVTPEQVEFLWHPYIPLGKLTILEGDPGLGKSWLALAIAAAISRGVKLPGATDPWGPADILLLSAEDGLADTITPRLDAMGADRGRITAITGIATDKGERGFSLAEHLDLLEEVLTQYRPIFVILDPLVSFLGAGVDMYRANEVRAILAPLASLAERCRAAILAIRHLTKSGRDKAIYRGQGNIDFVAAARSVILAGKEAETGKRGIVHTKSNLAPEGQAWGYAIEDGRFLWTGASDLTASRLLAPEGQEERGALAEAEDFLRQALAGGPRPVKQIQADATAMGISNMTLRRARTALGVVSLRDNKPGSKRGDGQWLWSLPSQDVQGVQDSTVEQLNTLNESNRKQPALAPTLEHLERHEAPAQPGPPDPWEALQ